MSDQFTPEEQHLIERLQNAPRPQLRPAARDALREQIMRELRIPAEPTQSVLKQQMSFTPRVVAATVAAIAVGLLLVFVIVQTIKPESPASPPSTTPTLTAPALIESTAVTAPIPQSSTPVVTPSSSPEATPSLAATTTPIPTMTPPANIEASVVIEGPVTAIENNIITIYSFDVELEPAHPFLTLVQVGDFIHVEGAFGNTGVIVATVVSNVTTVTTVGGATVGLDGPVEAINGNVLVVNGISAQLAPNDPLLQTVQVGNFVSLQGNFEGSGPNIILVVVNITIVNNVVIDNNPQCWFHDDAMGMGHWHCDGMGMGMGDDGMGMGMGDEGMGDAMGMGR
jgi:hypothetical protein